MSGIGFLFEVLLAAWRRRRLAQARPASGPDSARALRMLNGDE
jgi:hypothetical protein